MKEKINEEVLCVLKKDHAGMTEVCYVDIEQTNKHALESLISLCAQSESTIEQIVSLIQSNSEFDKLTANYRYCISLRSIYQGFSANNRDYIKEIERDFQLIMLNAGNESNVIELQERIKGLKNEIAEKYILWQKAFDINKAYLQCGYDSDVLIFSHRKNGWSNPVRQLTTNFSVEVKTNFGFGSVSYFYCKLLYKNISITPFSEWIEYEFAHFSEIVRYTQKYELENEFWLEAMEFCRDACNLSLTSEDEFVEKYIMYECEKMVQGLEDILSKDRFVFKRRNKLRHMGPYSVDKRGHVLLEFKGEKISGALDFISRIIEFDGIAAVRDFVKRIEECNRKIQPILVKGVTELEGIVNSLIKDKNALQPSYDRLNEKYAEFKVRRAKLHAQLIEQGKMHADNTDLLILESTFNKANPAFQEFLDEYEVVTNKYRILSERLTNNQKVLANIVSYDVKIKKHFGFS